MTEPSGADYTKEEWLEIAWSKNPPDLSPETIKVLEEYSKIPSEEIVPHVTKLRGEAFKIYPYPCIGQWRFLHLALGRHPRYQEVLRRMLTGNEIFLDIGCAFAQDIRRLVADGVDSSKCYGSDLHLDFANLGYELFRDKDSLKSEFIAADVFDDKSSLTALYGKVDIINASSFFHLFPREGQKKVAHRCLQLWSGKPGNLLLGRQVGNLQDGEHQTRAAGSRVYRHNSESWQKLWEEVGEESGNKFKVQSVLIDQPTTMPSIGHVFGRAEGHKIMVFSVERLGC